MARNRRKKDELYNKVLEIKRVSKKTKGGDSISFTALVVVGDREKKLGVALGKGLDVLSAINKGKKRAKKNMFEVPKKGATVPHDIKVKEGAAKFLIKPAPPGSGLIAAESIKALLQAAGYQDVSTKILGTNNKTTNVYAAVKALKELKKYERE